MTKVSVKSNDFDLNIQFFLGFILCQKYSKIYLWKMINNENNQNKILNASLFWLILWWIIFKISYKNTEMFTNDLWIEIWRKYDNIMIIKTCPLYFGR